MKKSRYDVSASHRAEKEKASARMREIEIEQPENFPFDKEWCRLREVIRQANINIRHYNDSIERGVKY